MMGLKKAIAHLSLHSRSLAGHAPCPAKDMLPGTHGQELLRKQDEDTTRCQVTPVTQDFVLISDDENNQDGFPLARRHRRPISLSTDSTSSLDPSDINETRDVPERPKMLGHHPHVHKRLRIGHATPRVRHQSPSAILQPNENKANQAVEVPKEYTKLRISFPNIAQGDHRARLSFQNPGITASSPKVPEAPIDVIPATLSADPSLKRVELDPKPYFYDPRLEVNLYCGPGYEKYPVVLGTVKGHKEICEKWDAQQAKNHQRTASNDAESSSSNPTRPNSAGTSEMSIVTDAFGSPSFDEDEQACLAETLQIFPQISHKFVVEKYRTRLQQQNFEEDFVELPTAADIIAEIAELDSFPKQADEEREQKKLNDDKDETGMSIHWDRDAIKNTMYYKESVVLLARFFDHVPTIYIQRILKEKKSLYSTYIHLRETEANYYALQPRPYCRSRNPRVQLEKKYSLGPNDQRDGHQYVNLVNEFQAARQQIERDRIQRENQKQREVDEANNLAVHKAEGALVECQCCFDEEIAINRAVPCEGDPMHFFCFSCVSQLAETQIGLMKYEMICMDGNGCKASLSTEGIGQAVTIKVFDKLAFYQQQAEISAADIEGLEQCPFCDFKAICEPIETDSVFFCQNTDCGRSSCRKCHEDSHVPRSCAEAKADKGLSARHLVEEARSEAMIRTCPQCKVKIIKESGCNKMRCTTCGCLMCYVCKKDISSGRDGGYEHFHKSGSNCKLYDDTRIDRHRDEADNAEREAIKKVRAENQDVEEDVLRVDTKKGDEASKQNRNTQTNNGARRAHQHPYPVDHFHHFNAFGINIIPPFPVAADDAFTNGPNQPHRFPEPFNNILAGVFPPRPEAVHLMNGLDDRNPLGGFNTPAAHLQAQAAQQRLLQEQMLHARAQAATQDNQFRLQELNDLHTRFAEQHRHFLEHERERGRERERVLAEARRKNTERQERLARQREQRLEQRLTRDRRIRGLMDDMVQLNDNTNIINNSNVAAREYTPYDILRRGADEAERRAAERQRILYGEAEMQGWIPAGSHRDFVATATLRPTAPVPPNRPAAPAPPALPTPPAAVTARVTAMNGGLLAEDTMFDFFTPENIDLDAQLLNPWLHDDDEEIGLWSF